MQEFEFKKWLTENDTSKKIISDIVSRIKRLERAINQTDIDVEYQQDHCIFLLSIFKNTGRNNIVSEIGELELPIGKYQLNTSNLKKKLINISRLMAEQYRDIYVNNKQNPYKALTVTTLVISNQCGDGYVQIIKLKITVADYVHIRVKLINFDKFSLI